MFHSSFYRLSLALTLSLNFFVNSVFKEKVNVKVIVSHPIELRHIIPVITLYQPCKTSVYIKNIYGDENDIQIKNVFEAYHLYNKLNIHL